MIHTAKSLTELTDLDCFLRWEINAQLDMRMQAVVVAEACGVNQWESLVGMSLSLLEKGTAVKVRIVSMELEDVDHLGGVMTSQMPASIQPAH